MVLDDIVGPEGDNTAQVVEIPLGALGTPIDILSFDMQIVEIPAIVASPPAIHVALRRALG